MRVCFVPQYPFGLFYGGGEVQATKTKEYLERRGHTVRWLELADRQLLENTDIFHIFGGSAFLKRWAQLAHEERPVVVSPIFGETSSIRRVLWKTAHGVVGTTPHDVSVLLHTADLLLPNAEFEGLQISRLFGIDATRMQVVPNGVDDDILAIHRESVVEKLLPQRVLAAPFVLSAHRIEAQKNTLNLLKAAVSVGVPLVLVGRINEVGNEEYVRSVMAYLKRYPEELFFLGPLPQEDLRELYGVAWVHAMPSHGETTGLSSLEAGLNGCNLVVGDCPPVREYFDGLAVIVDQSVQSIADGIGIALSKPRNAWLQAEAIREKYSWSRVAELTEEAYTKAIDVFHERRRR